MKEEDKDVINEEGFSDEDMEDYVPGEIVNDKGIPLLNDAIPLDEEQLSGLEGEGPKKTKKLK